MTPFPVSDSEAIFQSWKALLKSRLFQWRKKYASSFHISFMPTHTKEHWDCIKELSEWRVGITSNQSLWSTTQLWEEWSPHAFWFWSWLVQIHLLGSSHQLTSIIFLASQKIWRFDLDLLYYSPKSMFCWKIKFTIALSLSHTGTKPLHL